MTVYFFGYNTTKTLPAIPIIDAREIPNQYTPNQSDEDIRLKVRNHPLFDGLVLNTVLEHNEHWNVAVGCSFGIHRSRAVAEQAAYLSDTKARPWTQISLA